MTDLRKEILARLWARQVSLALSPEDTAEVRARAARDLLPSTLDGAVKDAAVALIADNVPVRISDAEISAQLGCTRENVRQTREKGGLPPDRQAPRRAAKVDRILADASIRAQLGERPDSEIARAYSVSPLTVSAARRALGIAAAPRPSRIRAYETQLGVLPDREVAQLAKTSMVAVVRWRARRGIPSRRRVTQHMRQDEHDAAS